MAVRPIVPIHFSCPVTFHLKRYVSVSVTPFLTVYMMFHAPKVHNCRQRASAGLLLGSARQIRHPNMYCQPLRTRCVV